MRDQERERGGKERECKRDKLYENSVRAQAPEFLERACESTRARGELGKVISIIN